MTRISIPSAFREAAFSQKPMKMLMGYGPVLPCGSLLRILPNYSTARCIWQVSGRNQ
jgi:hypothetical protein